MSFGFRTARGAGRWLSVGSILAVGLATAVVALAFYTAGGSGSGTAGAGTLPAPVITGTTPGAGTVTLTWTAAATPVGSGPVTYSVTRNGGAAAGDCPTAGAPTAVLTCTDSGLTAGTYTYTVTARWTSWTATSATRSVTLASGAASQLVFTTQPVGGVPEGVALGSSPVVAVRDAAGNLVSADTGGVTLAINSGPASGILSCSNGGFPTVAAVAGVATFTGCQVTGTAAAGTYTLKATRTGLTQAVSGNVTIQVGPASKLAFTTQPVGGVPEGVAFGTSPSVAVQDSFSNTVTTGGGSITLAINSGPASGILSCSNGGFPTVAAVAGVAAFTGCQVTGTAAAGTYTLMATRTGLTQAVSGNVTIQVGPASKLAFTTQPGNSTGGIAFALQPQVAVQDVFGNTVPTDTSSVSLTIGTNPSGGTLTCATNPVPAIGGSATFAGCAIDRAGTGYTLVATDGGLASATSTALDIAVGPAARLAFTVQPSGAVVARAFTTQPVVTIQDAGGNTVTAGANSVTLAIGTNPTGGGLACTTNPLATTAGVATFAGCRISKAGTGYTLTASAGALTAAISSPFDVVRPPIARVATGATVTRTGSGSFSPPIPTGLLGDDLMILIVANTKVNESAAPAGWTTVVTDGTRAGADMSLSVFYRFFQTGVTSPTVSVATDGGGASARIIAYRNVDPTTPLDVTPTAGVSATAAPTFTPPSLATLTANAYAVSIVAQNDRARTAPTLSLATSQGFALESGFPETPDGGEQRQPSRAVHRRPDHLDPLDGCVPDVRHGYVPPQLRLGRCEHRAQAMIPFGQRNLPLPNQGGSGRVGRVSRPGMRRCRPSTSPRIPNPIRPPRPTGCSSSIPATWSASSTPMGRFTSVNPAGEKLTGYAASDLVGRLAVELIAPELREEAVRRFRLRLHGDAPPYETVLTTRQGTRVPVLVTSALIGSGDQPSGVLGLISDLTERDDAEAARAEATSHLLEAEARFHNFFESAPIGEAIVALDGKFLEVNRRLCEIVGYSKAELAAMTSQEITHPDDLAADLEFVRQMLAREIRTYQIEKRYLRKDGQIVWILASVSLASSSSGEPSYFVSQTQDITEHRNAELERDQLREALRDSQKMEAIGRLAGGVAHDFNNMLTAIKGYSELLLGELQPGTRSHHEARQILRAAEQASSLPEQLLAFARRQPLEAKLVDINKLATTASQLLRHLIGERIELITIPAPQPAFAMVDPDRVEQILVNLALNARDAMPDGGSLTIAVSTTPITAEAALMQDGGASDPGGRAGSFVVISVADDGHGMDADTRDRAFEPFFTTKPRGTGSGLGLASVHGTVRQSGGFVQLESEPGQGTTVRLLFPAATAREVEAGHPRTEQAPLVLLAEDEDLVRELVSNILEREGFEVVAARNGLEALEQLEHVDRPLDVLVTDVVMPRMGGRELADRVAESQPQAKIVFISGYSDESPDLGTRVHAGSVLVSKPFSPGDLAETVNRLTSRPGSPRRPAEAEIQPDVVTCVVADDHSAVLDSVSRYLEAAGIGVVASVLRADDAVREIETHRPTTALVDITMEPFDGIEVARQAAVRSPDTGIVVYTGHHDSALLRKALDVGARGFVLKSTPPSELLTAITTVAAGGTYVEPLLAGALASAATAAPLVALTKRERQILTLLSGGMTNDKAARELGISAETIQSHVRNAMTKLDADTRTQAVATAIRQALIV